MINIKKKSYQTFKKSDSSLLILSIIQIMLPFYCHRGLSNGENRITTGFFSGEKSFPLDGAGGFGGYIVNYAVYVFYLVCDTI